MWPILFFLKKLLLCGVSHIEFLTRKILNVLVEWICPDGIIPDSVYLDWIMQYIYIYIYIYIIYAHTNGMVYTITILFNPYF